MYFNRKYRRIGSLFEGKFRSSHVAGDVYLKYLFSYIHLNPLKIQDKNWKSLDVLKHNNFEYIENYIYSSYLDYTHVPRIETNILSKNYFPEYFNKALEHKKELWFWFQQNNKG
jgi:hypothetical protein